MAGQRAALSQQETDTASWSPPGTRRPVCVGKGRLCVLLCILSVKDKLLSVCVCVLWSVFSSNCVYESVVARSGPTRRFLSDFLDLYLHER